MENQHHLWHLVARKLSSEATELETAELELLMHEDDDLSNMLQMLSHVWEQPADRRSPSDKKNVSDQYRKLIQKLKDTELHSR